MLKQSYVLTRLATITGLIYVVGGLFCSFLAYWIISQAMFEQSRQHLQAVLHSRATLVEDYFLVNQQQVAYLAQGEVIIEAVEAFSEGFSALSKELDAPTGADSQTHKDLLNYYQSEYAEQLPSKYRFEDQLKGYLPKSENGQLAQWIYIANNPNPSDRKNELFRADVSTTYEQVHRKFHPRLNHFLKSFEFYDVFLLDLLGNLVYSTKKEIDFGTNFLSGAHSQSGLGTAYRNAMASNVLEVTTIDFSRYAPSYFQPAAFLSSPVFNGSDLQGTVVFQLSADKVNGVISNLRGLGDSGETYIIGDDMYMRTDSRFVEESTILSKKVESFTAKEAIKGNSGFAVVPDYRGIDVLSHHRPLTIDGLHWGMLAELDESDVIAPATDLAWTIVLVIVLTLGLIALVSYVTLRLCVQRPLVQLTTAARKFACGDYSSRVDISSQDEFSILADSQNEMSQAVQVHITKLAKALSDVKELQGLLPICAACKSIRDDDGYFRTVESYFVGKSKLEFTHTICQECIPKLYPELAHTIDNKNG